MVKTTKLPYLKCSYFHTPSSCPSGGSSINDMFSKSDLINCWIYYNNKYITNTKTDKIGLLYKFMLDELNVLFWS